MNFLVSLLFFAGIVGGGAIGGWLMHRYLTKRMVEAHMALYRKALMETIKKFDLRLKHCELHIKSPRK